MANEQYLKSMEDNKILGPFDTDDEQFKEIIRATKYGGGEVENISKMATSTVVYATLAGVVIVGPLLGIMNSALFISTSTLLLISPLLLLFSPVLIPAGLVLVVALVGFAVSAVMALAALSMFALSYRSYKNRPATSLLAGGISTATSTGMETGTGDGGSDSVEEVAETVTESGQKVKQQVNELEKKVQVLPSSPPRQQHPSSKVEQIMKANKQAIVA